eukprot:TRINITY_DN104944_c0_g1_i1.p1 TRINITY_DN104944_c0_g1~~TRINITY_DN104944_c0_g1_i1.p1  ORF type:complete len:176 (+),score=60.17 TRINITY_DN104944_c0_g1_i1:95-622(+)
MANRERPNVLITGTPGVGKSTFSEELASATGLNHIEVARLVKEQKLYKEWDDEMDCSIFDEEMVCDALEPLLEKGGCILDFHSAGFLPDDWFDLVVVLRADTATLYDRLEKRHYPEAKIKQNVEAEIFQTCLEEAREAFEEAQVNILEMPHDNQDQLDEAVQKVKQCLEEWRPSC